MRTQIDPVGIEIESLYKFAKNKSMFSRSERECFPCVSNLSSPSLFPSSFSVTNSIFVYGFANIHNKQTRFHVCTLHSFGGNILVEKMKVCIMTASDHVGEDSVGVAVLFTSWFCEDGVPCRLPRLNFAMKFIEVSLDYNGRKESERTATNSHGYPRQKQMLGMHSRYMHSRHF